MRDSNLNYIKTQVYEDIIKLSKESQEFVDDFFPPLITSLVPANRKDPIVKKTPEKYVRDYLTYSFSRPSTIYGKGNFCIFSKKSEINTQDIIQGSMASCYLIVALANMSRIPKRIYDLFLSTEVNDVGVYGMKVYVQGEPKIVLVDDFFPSKDGKFTFSMTQKDDNEMWVQICEKVWGKVNQACYLRTFLGTPQEALYFLAPSPSYYIHHREYKTVPSYLWELLTTSMAKNYLICTNTEEINDESNTGLFKFHAYGVLDLIEVDDIQLIKLRNPWGDKEWKGKYSNVNSPEWTEKLKKKVNTKDLVSGSFFMSFEDYLDYFPWSFYSKLDDSWYYKYLKYEISVDVGDHSLINRTYLESSIMENLKKNEKEKINSELLKFSKEPTQIQRVGNNKEANDNYYYKNSMLETPKEKNQAKKIISGNRKKESSLDLNKDNDYLRNKKNSMKSLKITQDELQYNQPKMKKYDDMTNLKTLENYKLVPELLNHGDMKIFDVINRNIAGAFFIVEKKQTAVITLHQPQKRFI